MLPQSFNTTSFGIVHEMTTNNPYAQGGWSNPENPLSINNGTWGSQSPPQPSLYGALPLAIPPIPPTIITFHFLAFSPTILNCSVVGPQARKCYSINTSSPSVGASTLFYDPHGQNMAAIEWQRQPTVEVRGVVARQPASQWLSLSQDRSNRIMGYKGKWYVWVPRDNVTSLFTAGPTPPELLARASREQGAVKLDITAQAVQVGLLDLVVVAVLLLHSERNFG